MVGAFAQSQRTNSASEPRRTPTMFPDEGPSAGAAAPATLVYKAAVVNADGTLARGKGVVSSSGQVFDQPGFYQVIFNRDVSHCFYSATLGPATPDRVAYPGEISAAPRSANPNGYDGFWLARFLIGHGIETRCEQSHHALMVAELLTSSLSKALPKAEPLGSSVACA